MSAETLSPTISAPTFTPAVEAGPAFSAPVSIPSADVHIPAAAHDIFSMPKLDIPNIAQAERVVPGKLAFTHTVPEWEAPKPFEVTFDPGKSGETFTENTLFNQTDSKPNVESLRDILKNTEPLVIEDVETLDKTITESLDPNRWATLYSNDVHQSVIAIPSSSSSSNLSDLGIEDLSNRFGLSLTIEDLGVEDLSREKQSPLLFEIASSPSAIAQGPRNDNVAVDPNSKFEIREETQDLIDKYIETYQPKTELETLPEEHVKNENQILVNGQMGSPKVDQLSRIEAVADVNQALKVLEIAREIKNNDEEAEELTLHALQTAFERKGISGVLTQPQLEDKEDEKDLAVNEESKHTLIKVETKELPKTADAGQRVPPRIDAKPKADEENPEAEKVRVLREVETIIFERDKDADAKRKNEIVKAAHELFQQAIESGDTIISANDVVDRMPKDPQPREIKSQLVKYSILPDGSYPVLGDEVKREGKIFSEEHAKRIAEKKVQKIPAVRASTIKTSEEVTEKDVKRVLTPKPTV